MADKEPVVVTTEAKGVFFGYREVGEGSKESIRLTEARMCIYWPTQNKGVLGLAVEGPLKGARVGPAVKAITLYGITAVTEATDGAVKKWLAAPWQ